MICGSECIPNIAYVGDGYFAVFTKKLPGF